MKQMCVSQILHSIPYDNIMEKNQAIPICIYSKLFYDKKVQYKLIKFYSFSIRVHTARKLNEKSWNDYLTS